VLTSGPGWQWVFYVNVPVGVAVLAGVLAVVPPFDADPPSGGIDLLGAVLVTASSGLVILGITRAGTYGWGARGSWLPIVLGVLGYGLFVGVERRLRQPLVRLGVFLQRPVAAGSFCVLLSSALLISGFFLGSLYLQHTVGLSAMRTGLVFLPVAAAVIAGAGLASVLLSVLGYRVVAAAGLVVTAGGTWWLTGLPQHGETSDLLPGLLLAAAGAGAAFVAATATALSEVQHAEAGLTSGVVNTFHEIGGAMGVALASAFAAASLAPVPGGGNGFDKAFLGFTVIAVVGAVVVLVTIPAGKLAAGTKPPMI
jgi:hypothetical protein